MNKTCIRYLAHREKTDSLPEESIQPLPTNQATLKNIKNKGKGFNYPAVEGCLLEITLNDYAQAYIPTN